MLHIELWQGRQSGIPGIGRSSCVNKAIIRHKWCMGVSSSRGLRTRMQGRWEIIYTQRHGQSQSHGENPASTQRRAGAKWLPGIPRRRSRRNAKFGPEYEINVVKKLLVSIAVFRLFVPPTNANWGPFEKLKCECYILMNKCNGHSFIQYITQIIHIYIYIYEGHTISFQTFFRMGTFIDSTHMKL